MWIASPTIASLLNLILVFLFCLSRELIWKIILEMIRLSKLENLGGS